MIKMELKGILFDLDGTLIDSMKDNYLAWKDALIKEDIILEKKEYYALEGTPVKEIARFFLKERATPENIQKVVETKNKNYLVNHKIKFYPGVEEFVDFIKSKNLLTAIVSASPYEKLDRTVPRRFLDKFDCLISGDCTSRGKPYPDPYLTAASKMGLKPEECIVIENAPLGIKSAKNAGMFCIGIGSTLSKNSLQEADIFIEKFAELANLEIFGSR